MCQFAAMSSGQHATKTAPLGAEVPLYVSIVDILFKLSTAAMLLALECNSV